MLTSFTSANQQLIPTAFNAMIFKPSSWDRHWSAMVVQEVSGIPKNPTFSCFKTTPCTYTAGRYVKRVAWNPCECLACWGPCRFSAEVHRPAWWAECHVALLQRPCCDLSYTEIRYRSCWDRIWLLQRSILSAADVVCIISGDAINACVICFVVYFRYLIHCSLSRIPSLRMYSLCG